MGSLTGKFSFFSRRNRDGQPKEGKALGRYTLAAFLAAGLVFAGLALLFYQQWMLSSEQQLSKYIQLEVQRQAVAVHAKIRAYGETLASMARNPILPRLIEGGDKRLLQVKEQELKYAFPGAIRVRLLPLGLNDVDEQSVPPLSYSGLALLRTAEGSDGTTLAEVQLLGRSEQYVAMAHRILSADREVAGVLFLALEPSVFANVLSRLGLADSYLELRQGTNQHQAFARYGNGQLASDPPQGLIPIEDSRWQLAYWLSTPGESESAHLMFWGGVAAGLLMLGLIFYARDRVFAHFLRGDLITLVNLVRDLQRGQLQGRYKVHLSDFKGAVAVIQRMTSEEQTGEETVVSAAASSGNAISNVVFEATEGIKVEEQLPKQGGPIAASIFKAYDIRGVVGETLTSETVYEIGRAIGSEAHAQGQQNIIVGRDGRLSGPELSQSLIEGLRATGREVVDIGVVPTPVLYFATQYLSTGSGVMLTGSHNPPHYNGMKIMLRGETLALDAIQALRHRIDSGDYTSGTGDLQAVDVVPDYIERVTSDVKLIRPLKIVVDCGNGAAGEVAPRLFRALGSEVIELYCEIDGQFPHHHPDPSQSENLEDLINKVKEEGADLGLAFDGDGDRLGVIDSQGRIIWPDRQLMLYAMDVLSRHPGATILYDIKCSRHLDQIITEYGGSPLMWKTGHSLIKAKMRETGALLAGEMSGHLFFKERWFGFDDALYAGARLLEILAADTRTSGEVFAALPEAVSTPELRVEMAEGEHFRFMERLLHQAQFPDAAVTTIDGLRVDFEEGWGLVRPSNTTPCLVLRFEANDGEALERIKDTFRRLLLEVDPSLALPF
ncbi:phosphomannomutase/phosphoglucomutase [Nitrosococcus wardiae]|uniref:phosphomannomutase n=1 Tax=Nitrosococcus wardiae TaxID=1814290 RepID=A0A4P7BUN3_9GAMM|nr:phosphomannomutase/phosphoglucomutase [Nitrosococcus wardiae]